MEYKCFDHLSRLRCKQDENEFTLALMSVLSRNIDFRNRFLRECGYQVKGKGLGATQHFQWTSAFSRPDFLLEIVSSGETLALISVEVKVESPVDKTQLENHLDGLDNREKILASKSLMEPYCRLVVLTKQDDTQFQFAQDVKWLSWNGVRALLKQSRDRDPVAKYLAETLADALEARGMTEFEGFDVDEWSGFVGLYTGNKDLMERVEDKLAQFVSNIKDRVKKAVEDETKPFNDFSKSIHGRGRRFQFWIRGKRGSPTYYYYTGLKIEPYEGWIEVFISAEGSEDSISLLRNLRKKRITKMLDGWSLWFMKGWREDVVDIDVYDEVMKERPAEAALILRSHLDGESESFKTKEIERKIWSRIEGACEIFKMLE